MIDILVFSHSSLKAINRSVYQILLQKGWNIEIIAPSFLWETDGTKITADPVFENDPPMHFLELSHHQDKSRVYKFIGEEEILNDRKPRIILCENDPVSMMAVRLGRWAKKNNSILICQSCENLGIDPVSVIKRLGLKSLPVALIKYSIMLSTRPLVDHVLTINDAGTKVFRNLGYRQVTKIPLGYNPGVFYPSEENRQNTREALGIKGEVPVIAYIGRMVPQKGVHLLMKALGQLKDYQWILMMDKFKSKGEPYFEELEAIETGLGLSDRIRYIEADHFEIARYMNAADVVVIPSTSTQKWVEQYGRVAPEAMACAKLVMAADTGALPELVADAGVLFEENNVDALKRALEDYLKDPEKYDDYPEKALKRASEKLSIQVQADMLESLISEELTPV